MAKYYTVHNLFTHRDEMNDYSSRLTAIIQRSRQNNDTRLNSKVFCLFQLAENKIDEKKVFF